MGETAHKAANQPKLLRDPPVEDRRLEPSAPTLLLNELVRAKLLWPSLALALARST